MLKDKQLHDWERKELADLRVKYAEEKAFMNQLMNMYIELIETHTPKTQPFMFGIQG